MKVNTYKCNVCLDLFTENKLAGIAFTDGEYLGYLHPSPDKSQSHICKGCVLIIRNTGKGPGNDDRLDAMFAEIGEPS